MEKILSLVISLVIVEFITGIIGIFNIKVFMVHYSHKNKRKRNKKIKKILSLVISLIIVEFIIGIIGIIGILNIKVLGVFVLIAIVGVILNLGRIEICWWETKEELEED